MLSSISKRINCGFKKKKGNFTLAFIRTLIESTSEALRLQLSVSADKVHRKYVPGTVFYLFVRTEFACLR